MNSMLSILIVNKLIIKYMDKQVIISIEEYEMLKKYKEYVDNIEKHSLITPLTFSFSSFDKYTIMSDNALIAELTEKINELSNTNKELTEEVKGLRKYKDSDDTAQMLGCFGFIAFVFIMIIVIMNSI